MIAAWRARSIRIWQHLVYGQVGSIQVEGRATEEERLVRRDHAWGLRRALSMMVLKALWKLEWKRLLEVVGKLLVAPVGVAFMVLNREVRTCLFGAGL